MWISRQRSLECIMHMTAHKDSLYLGPVKVVIIYNMDEFGLILDLLLDNTLPSGDRVSICLAISSQLPNPNCSIASNNLTSSFAVQLLRPRNIPNAPES